MQVLTDERLTLDRFMRDVRRRSPGEEEFHQAVTEVAEKVIPFINDHPEYLENRILTRLTEPDRVIMFRVCWEDDDGHVRMNRGYRVQFNNSIGPYKGGLRFDPSVNLSVLKFLAFEQVFKNSLTTLPMGGGKGGSDFNPKGKSDAEVMRFCQAFMTELSRHIGAHVDVPAGDIGVGAREVGFLFGQYKRLQNEFTGVLTGKGLTYGGSLIRPEATGYGSVYFAREMLATRGEDLEGKTCVISGAGNVAQYTAEKLIDLGARVVALSDRQGTVHDSDGLTPAKLNYVMELKNKRRGTLREFADEFGLNFFEGARPWGITCDCAFPSATQNELDGDDARTLLDNGCILVSEGANMPSTPEAVELFEESGILYGPGKAANAGGVAISGLEMTQNSMRISWSREEVDRRLQGIMRSIHEQCEEYGGTEQGGVNYVKGANIGGFVKVAESMVAQGVV
ncbi:MAG: NADP-specific glutamate dehydrogenase [Bacteroidetes bacterium]|nr:NADP-specific glutamate dehydrogenase [Bacteroidota bacterium]